MLGADLFVVIGAAERLQNLVRTLRNDLSVTDDLLAFLHHSLGRREGLKEMLAHGLGEGGIHLEVLRTVITEMLISGLGGVYIRNGVRLRHASVHDGDA